MAKQKSFEHVVTEQDLVNNPELLDEGVMVGDTIEVPESEKGKYVVDNTISTKSVLTETEQKEIDPTATVDFKVSYSKDFKGDKIMPEDSIHAVAPDVAELFTKKGIGSVVK